MEDKAAAISDHLEPAEELLGTNIEKENDQENEPAFKRPRGRPPKESLDDLEVAKRQLKIREDELKAMKTNIKKQVKTMTESANAENRLLSNKLIETERRVQMLEKSLGERSDEINSLHEENDSKYKEIDDLRERLQQKQLEYEDLLEQLDTLDLDTLKHTSISPTVFKPTAAFVCDVITKPLSKNLPNSYVWKIVDKGLLDLKVSDLENFDVAFLVTGTNELSKGEAWSDLTKKAALILEEAPCQVFFINLPPANKRPLSGRISLLNHRINKLDAMTLAPDISNMSKTNFLSEDEINLTSEGCTLYMNLIKEELVKLAPTIEKKEYCPSTEVSNTGASAVSNDMKDLKAFVQIEPDFIGRIIGKGGHTIKKLVSENDVEISVGCWCEKDKDKELKIISDGVLVNGSLAHIKNTIEQIKFITKK